MNQVRAGQVDVSESLLATGEALAGMLEVWVGEMSEHLDGACGVWRLEHGEVDLDEGWADQHLAPFWALAERMRDVLRLG